MYSTELKPAYAYDKQIAVYKLEQIVIQTQEALLQLTHRSEFFCAVIY